MTLEQANKKARSLWGRNAKAYTRTGTLSPCGVGVFGTTIKVGKVTAQPWGVGATFEEAFEVAEASLALIQRTAGKPGGTNFATFARKRQTAAVDQL